MKITVLPVRNPDRREPSAPRAAPSAPAAPARAFEGMPPATVELLHAARRRPVQAPRPQPAAAAPPAPAPDPAAPRAAGAVEIELPNGRVVRVPPGFSSADLERVLAIASGGAGAGDGTPEGR